MHFLFSENFNIWCPPQWRDVKIGSKKFNCILWNDFQHKTEWRMATEKENPNALSFHNFLRFSRLFSCTSEFEFGFRSFDALDIKKLFSSSFCYIVFSIPLSFLHPFFFVEWRILGIRDSNAHYTLVQYSTTRCISQYITCIVEAIFFQSFYAISVVSFSFSLFFWLIRSKIDMNDERWEWKEPRDVDLCIKIECIHFIVRILNLHTVRSHIVCWKQQ